MLFYLFPFPQKPSFPYSKVNYFLSLPVNFGFRILTSLFLVFIFCWQKLWVWKCVKSKMCRHFGEKLRCSGMSGWFVFVFVIYLFFPSIKADHTNYQNECHHVWNNFSQTRLSNSIQSFHMYLCLFLVLILCVVPMVAHYWPQKI